MQSHSRWLRRPAESAGLSATEGAQCNTHITKCSAPLPKTSAFTQHLLCFSSSDSKQRWAIQQWGNWGTGELKSPPIGTAKLRQSSKLPQHRSGLHNWIDSQGSSARAWDKHCVLCTPGSKLLPGTHCGAPSQAPCLAPLISLPFWLRKGGTDNWSGNLKSKQIK